MQDLLTDTLKTQLCEDSVFVVVETSPVSLFHGHQLQPENGFSYLERSVSSGSFGLFILFICAGIILYLQRNSDGIFSTVIKASFDINQANQDARVQNSQRSRNLLIIQIVSAISIALFLTGAIPHFAQSKFSPSELFFSIIGALLIGVFFKRIMLLLLAQLFNLSSEFRFHRFNLSVLFSAIGLVLLPLSLLLLYSPQIPFMLVIYFGASVAVFFYLKGLQRGISVALSSTAISTLHLFYYFCALEILPIFVLIRFAL
ncbi:MAG: hypothetical protein ACJAVL_000573 [Bacteroidia bacterium]